MGEKCVLYMHTYDNLPPPLPPAVCLAERLPITGTVRLLSSAIVLARETLSMVKWKNAKSARCGLYNNEDLPHLHIIK